MVVYQCMRSDDDAECSHSYFQKDRASTALRCSQLGRVGHAWGVFLDIRPYGHIRADAHHTGLCPTDVCLSFCRQAVCSDAVGYVSQSEVCLKKPEDMFSDKRECFF